MLGSVKFDFLGIRRKWGNRPYMAAVEGMNGGGGVGNGPKMPPFLRDLSAHSQKLPKIIGRNKEMTDMIQKLLARGKNSFVLVGSAGVGKTTVARGLARLAALNNGEGAPALRGRKFVELDLPSLLAESGGNPGKFGRCLEELRDWLKQENAVLIIDEICSINQIPVFGDLFWNTLKSSLAEDTEGEKITIIGTTTHDQYVKYIENDEGGMARRLPRIEIKEPTPNETFQFLTSIKTRWENEAGMKISHIALRRLVDLAQKFVPSAFPDKALTVMDETAARLKDEAHRRQRVLADIAERLTIRMNNALAVRKGQDPVSRQLTDHSIREMLAEYETVCAQCEQAIPEVITPEIIEESIAIKTGIPLSRLTEDESKRLLQIEEIMGKRVIGQEAAKKAVASAVKRSRQGLRDQTRPAGVFMFLGPTGVGKTELARELARFLFYSEENLVRIDMSEYQQEHDVKKLTGAPPSYVGYGDPGKFEAVRRKKYTVVLFDEIEKGHPRVLDLLLQILDYGKCTDSQGREIDFTNSYIIMTSNLGAGKNAQEVRGVLKECMRPELLGRIGEDNQIVFDHLTREDMRKMVDIHTRDIKKQIYDKGCYLELTEGAKDVIAKVGYQPQYGARPLKQAITVLLNPLSDLFLTGRFSAGDTIRVEAEGSRLVFVKGEPGKFEPPRVNLSEPTEGIWQKLNDRVDQGSDFALEELYPLMPMLPQPKAAEPAPEAVPEEPVPVPVEVKPEAPAPVEPAAPPQAKKLRAPIDTILGLPQLPPPQIPATVKVEVNPTLWQANETALAEAARSFLKENGKKPPDWSIRPSVLKAKLKSVPEEAFRTIIFDLFFTQTSNLVSSISEDNEIVPKPDLTVQDFGQAVSTCLVKLALPPLPPPPPSQPVPPERILVREGIKLSSADEKTVRDEIKALLEKREAAKALAGQLRNMLALAGATGTAEDISFLTELLKHLKESKIDGQYELIRESVKAIIFIAKRSGDKETLKGLIGQDQQAQDALAELATAEDLPWISKMLLSEDRNARRTALLMLGKVGIGSRQDLPRIIKRLRTDQDREVKRAAARAFAEFATRDDLPMIREMAAGKEDWVIVEAAGLAFARIAAREDLDEIRKYFDDYKTRDYFKRALIKIITREDLDFEAFKDYIERRKGSWTSSKLGDDVTEIYLDAFVRLARPEDIALIKTMLQSENKEVKRLGFRGWCELLTEYDTNQLFPYLKDYFPTNYRSVNDLPSEAQANIGTALIAAEHYARLATEDDLPEIKGMLRGRVAVQRLAAALALSKPGVAPQIPPALKESLKQLAAESKDDIEKAQFGRLNDNLTKVILQLLSD